ncbi:hypothetical protein [Prevotella sp.]|nr:hypothetical protein [Prevotella sp.]
MEFDVSFKIIDKENFFEIVANDTYGRTLPDSVMCPKEGDISEDHDQQLKLHLHDGWR